MDFASGWQQIVTMGTAMLTCQTPWGGSSSTFAGRMMNQILLLIQSTEGFTYHRSSRWSSLCDTGSPWPDRPGWLRRRPSHIWHRYLLETRDQLVSAVYKHWSTSALWLVHVVAFDKDLVWYQCATLESNKCRICCQLWWSFAGKLIKKSGCQTMSAWINERN